MAGKNAPAPRVSGEPRPFQNVVSGLAQRAVTEAATVDAFDVGSRVIDKMAEASSLDEMFDAAQSSLLSLKDATKLHNVPVTVFDVRYAKSDKKYEEHGVGAYVIIDLFTDDGTVWKISCGAPNVVSFLHIAETKGLFRPALDGEESNPKELRLRFTARDTANGTLLSIARP